MSKILIATLCASSVILSPAAAAASPATGDSSAKVCKFVVTPERGEKPFEMCLTKAEWAAKEKKDAKDPNRIVCRYEDVPGSKLKSRKVCQPASAWAEDRQMHREQIEQMQMRVCVAGAGC